MTEPDSRDEGGFLARWSRLKRQGGAEPAEERQTPAPTGPAKDEVTPAEANTAAESDPSADDDTVPIEELPPIESIDANTDLTPWLKKKLPAEWKQAALRKLWASDEFISTYIGPVEYGWDWNAPDGVPGFGSLRATDNVGSLIAQAMGRRVTGGKADEPHGDTGAVQEAQTQTADSGPETPLRDPDHEPDERVTAAAQSPEMGQPGMRNDIDAGKSAPDTGNQHPVNDRPRRGGSALPV